MTFEQRNMGEFLEARKLASMLIIQETPRKSRLTLIEAITLQGASFLHLAESAVYGTRISQLVDVNPPPVNTALKEFERIGVYTEAGELIRNIRGPRPTLYIPTELGSAALEFFRADYSGNSEPWSRYVESRTT